MNERRKETGLDGAGVLRLVAFVLLLASWRWALAPMFKHVVWISPETKNNILGITPTAGAAYYGISPASSGPTLDPYLIVTPSPFPTYTPYPTYTPMATITPVYELSNHRFSFYDPMIGKDKPEIAEINCAKWNYETNYCDSALRSGERWEDNYFISAACPYDLYVARAHFEVVSPQWLKDLFPRGFTCKDTGELVTGLFIDFLIPWRSMPMPYDQTPWGTPITLMRTR